MPRHDATSRVVNQSLFDIDEDISPLARRKKRAQTRYTSISVESSNVAPISRARTRLAKTPKTRQSRTPATGKTRSANRKADVIHLHDGKHKRDAKSSPVTATSRQGEKRNPKQLNPAMRKQSNNKVIWYPKRRARILAAVLLIPFVLISIRLFDIQVIHSKKYATYGVEQRRLVREITPARGTITDRNGNILAVSEPAYSVVADPSLIKDDDELLNKLHKVTVFKDEDVASLLDNKKSRYAMLVRHVDEATAKRVQKEKLPGISVIKDPKREYPSDDIAPNVIGFVGTDMDGLGGLEFMMDASLAGKAGQEVIERDPKGREIPSARRDVQGAVRGNDVSLTLDVGLQYEAQRIVLEEVAATRSKGGTAIIADVKTGEILSMVSIVGGPDKPVVAPATDRNHAVTDVYEPGSTNKVITISGALEDRIISTGTQFSVPDTITFDDTDFVDSHKHEPMTWNAGDILRESSNVGTIMISNKLKKKRLDHYLRAYGFGSKTALNFPGEASGILLDPKDWSDTSIATVPIGNGLAVTPMQMLSVYMTIANFGMKVEPRLIKSFIASDGTSKGFSTKEPTRVISHTTAMQLQSMLRGAVEEGTGKLANLSGYSVAGKTGTARKPPYNKPPYKYIASFAGFSPANNPRLASIVILDEPQGQIYGGTVAAPVFSRIMQSALRVMGIEPDQSIQGQAVTNEPSITTTTTTTTTRVPVAP